MKTSNLILPIKIRKYYTNDTDRNIFITDYPGQQNGYKTKNCKIVCQKKRNPKGSFKLDLSQQSWKNYFLTVVSVAAGAATAVSVVAA